jgi:hypothetical protein
VIETISESVMGRFDRSEYLAMALECTEPRGGGRNEGVQGRGVTLTRR